MKNLNKQNQSLIIRKSRILSLALAVGLLFSTSLLAQPTIPVLSLPDSGAVNQPHSLKLMWKTAALAETYHLQVSDTVSFSRTVFDKSNLTDTTQYLENLAFNKNYYWRVSAKTAIDSSAFSDTSCFETWASVPVGPLPVNMLSVEGFAILAYAAVTNVPSSAIKGDVGLTPISGSFIDLSQVEVTGFIYTVDANGPAGSIESPVMLTVAKGDLTIAYNDAAGRTVSPIGIAGNLGGQTIYPGLYKSTGTLEISAGDLTLDANGNEDAVWIFQIASSFNMTSGRQVFLANGAKAGNVFWQMGSAATFGTTIVMKGTIMAGTQVTFGTGASLEGRALALTENVTLQQNAITLPDFDMNTAIGEENASVPSGISLEQNYPNPFNPTTSIRFGIDKASDVRLEVFTMLGQNVSTLVNEMKAAGFYTVSFDASNLSSGFYTYRITTDGKQLVKTMTLIK
ncbi:MAG: DUF3494 domain-containing protein [Bacteroidetes bacterium]|nr:DUF3494 domain-containing protein [Bacteroidota bacterium]NCQ11175.1 DUF3494 domain-containing protein [Bacteroidota bacterium]